MGDLGNSHALLFSSVPVGGNIQFQPGETLEVRYFSLDEIPEDLSFGHRKRIEDAVNGIGGSIAVIQEMNLPSGSKITREDIIKARKLPREERLAFYERTMKQAEMRVKIEVGENS
jgi:hypothetical protein